MRKDPSDYVRVQIVLYPNKDKDLISIMLYLRNIGADMGPLYRHILRKFVSGDNSPVAIPGFASTNSIRKSDRFYIEVRLTPAKDKAVLDFIKSLGARTHNFVIKNIARIYFGPNVIWPNRDDFDEDAANIFTKKIQKYNIEKKVDPGRIQVITPNTRLVTKAAPPVVEVVPVYSSMLDDTTDIEENSVAASDVPATEEDIPVQTKKPDPPAEKTKTAFIPNFEEEDDDNNSSAFEEEETKPTIQFDEEEDDNPGFEEVTNTSDSDDDYDDDSSEFDIMSMINSFEE